MAPVSAKVVVAARDKEAGPFQVTGIDSGAPWVTASARVLPEGEQLADHPPVQYEITVQVSDQARVGMLNVPLVVRTDHAKVQTLSLKVIGVVRNPA